MNSRFFFYYGWLVLQTLVQKKRTYDFDMPSFF